MTAMRYVYLDPDAISTGGWLYVVVRAQTGVVYQQQYGGTACRQGKVEGYLVPLYGQKDLGLLRELFEGHFRGAGTWNYQWRADEIERLRQAVAGVGYWTSDEFGQVSGSSLQLDDERLAEADEAWIPVLTPHGPGLLLWYNSA